MHAATAAISHLRETIRTHPPNPIPAKFRLEKCCEHIPDAEEFSDNPHETGLF